MANVAINQLNLIGYELFHDSESFLDELTSQDIGTLEGGGTWSGFGGSWSGFSGSWSGFSGGYSGSYGGYGFGHKSWC